MLDEKVIYSIVEKAKKYDELVFMPEKKKEVSCSFCGKSQSAVEKIVMGAGVSICNECIELCNEILVEEKQETESEKEEEIGR